MELILDLLWCLLAENHREKKHPQVIWKHKNTSMHTHISLCVFAHTCVWDSETCPQRRSSFSLPPPNTLWGRRDMSFCTEGSTRGKDKPRSAALYAQRDCGLPDFPYPIPLHRSCSQSKPRAHSEIKIIINFSFALVSAWGFGLVHTSKIKAVVCLAKKLLQKYHQ